MVIIIDEIPVKTRSVILLARISNLSNLLIVSIVGANVINFTVGSSFAVIPDVNRIDQIARLSDREQQERLILIQTINQLLRDRNLTGAEENARKFTTKFPKDAFGYFQLGNVLFRQDKAEDAIKAYQQAIVLNPEYALAYNATGEVYTSQYRWQDAANAYNQALKINPEYAQALANLAQALWEQGKRAEAIASLEKVVSLFKSQNQTDKAERIERILRDLKRTDDPAIS